MLFYSILLWPGGLTWVLGEVAMERRAWFSAGCTFIGDEHSAYNEQKSVCALVLASVNEALNDRFVVNGRREFPSPTAHQYR